MRPDTDTAAVLAPSAPHAPATDRLVRRSQEDVDDGDEEPPANFACHGAPIEVVGESDAHSPECGPASVDHAITEQL